MLTPTELKNKQFSKAMFGGYAMAEVDGLLDRLTPDYETVYNDNAELRKKVEVLLQRIEHYQEQEDSIKAAILNAQRMCDNIVAQAKQQAALIEQDAKARAEKLEEEAERGIVDKRREYERICTEVTEFRNGLVEMYRAHLDKIREIPAFADPEEQETSPEEQEPSPEAGAQEQAQEEAPEPPATAGVAEPALSAAVAAAQTGVDMQMLERRIAQQFSDLEKTMEFTLPSQTAREPVAERESALQEPRDAAPAERPSAEPEEPAEVVEILDEGPQPLLQHLPEDSAEEEFGGIPAINLEDSLQFGEEFDVATGKKNS